MELSINNAVEAAVNAPFNSTGLQTSVQLFFLGCRCSMRGLYIRLYGFARAAGLPGLSLSTSIPTAEPLIGFHQGPPDNGVSDFTDALRRAASIKKEIMPT